MSNPNLPTPLELEEAAARLAWAFSLLDIKFGVIGGSAVQLWARNYADAVTRQTEDVDVIIQPTSEITAESILDVLSLDPRVSKYFTSKIDRYVMKLHVVVTHGDRMIHVPIECFDHEVWPSRRGYYDLSMVANVTVPLTLQGQPAPVLNPPWLLRQKIITHSERGSVERRESDGIDIVSLVRVMRFRSERLVISDSYEIEALKQVCAATPDLQTGLKRVVDCLSVFNHAESVMVR